MRRPGFLATRWERSPQHGLAVTHRNVEALLGRLATDPAMRTRFVEDPGGVLRELTEQGYELTPVEIEALASTDGNAICSFADTLDRRIRRAAVNPEPITPVK